MKKNLPRKTTIRHSLRLYCAPLVLAMVAATNGCTAPVASTPAKEAEATNDQAITGGSLINNTQDDVSSMFPLSTVTIICMFPAEGELAQCSGTMISPIQILTAAHCCPGGGGTLQTVYQYNTVKGNADFVRIQTYTAPFPIPIVPDGVTGENANGYDTNGNYADLELITLPNPLPLPVTPAIPGIPGTFTSAKQQTLWEVGSGPINGHANPNLQMAYVPIAALGANDDGGQFAGLTTNGGVPPGAPGDSGGPVYQLLSNTLLVVGVTSYWSSTATHFTSVLSSANRSWIMNHYAAPPTQQEIVRNRQFIEPSDRPSFTLSPPAAPVEQGSSLFSEL